MDRTQHQTRDALIVNGLPSVMGVRLLWIVIGDFEVGILCFRVHPLNKRAASRRIDHWPDTDMVNVKLR